MASSAPGPSTLLPPITLASGLLSRSPACPRSSLGSFPPQHPPTGLSCPQPEGQSPPHKGQSPPGRHGDTSSPKPCPRSWLLPLLGIVHEEEVEQTQPGLRQPGELVLEVVVRLLPQGVLTHQGQLGETLKAGAQRIRHRQGGRAALTEQLSPARCSRWASPGAAR